MFWFLVAFLLLVDGYIFFFFRESWGADTIKTHRGNYFT